MRRREFITLLGGSAAAWPLAARAQQATMPVIGFLGSATEADYRTTIATFREGLKQSGYVEGQNLLIDYRWANFRYERLPALAAELANRPVDAIFATGSVVSALAAKAATPTIPIVFANGSDPVQYGLVASLNRPGGNVTGITFINSQLGPKRIQLLRLLNPKTATIAVLVNPKNPNAADAKAFEAAGRGVGMEIVIVNASTGPEINEAFNRAVEQHADALLVHVDALFNDGAGQSKIITLMEQHRLPTMMANTTFPARGGLISYGADTRELNRQAGVYVARVLRGEKPVDLPVVQPTNFALV
jgi:putative ABC transport system substrate-binding protein